MEVLEPSQNLCYVPDCAGTPGLSAGTPFDEMPHFQPGQKGDRELFRAWKANPRLYHPAAKRLPLLPSA
jgi:hypothetical protein